jgi:hypothetical protein
VSKKTPAKQKNSRVKLPPGAVIYGKATSITVDGTRVVRVHGTGGPLTSLIAKKGHIQIDLPSATMVGASPDSKYVAWAGESYVLRPTLESILEDDNLILIGRVDDPRDWSPLHQQVAAFSAIKTLIEGPVLRVPESLVRRALAGQYACTPDEVTQKQIMEELADLGDYYPRIEVTITKPVSPSESGEPNLHIADANPVPRQKNKKKPSPLERQKRSIIFGALQSNLEGRHYCIKLDQKGLLVPLEWKSEGCPDTYANAYMVPSGVWRKRIQDEKSRYRKKYNQSSPTEREKSIQQADVTRRPRQ